MAFWNKKKENQITRKTRKEGQMFTRARLDPAAMTWYGVNRGFLNSPNNEIRIELEKTRDLSRLLATIDPYCAKYLELLAVYVVGEQGIKVDPRTMNSDGELDSEINKTIRDAWLEWTQEASFDGRYTFNELEHLGIRTIGRDGEMLMRIVRGKKVNKFGFALQPVDPSLLDINYNATISNTAYITMGVEYEGVRPVAYHIWNRYADNPAGAANTNRIRERIPADQIIHIYDDDYGQLVRGLPWTTPALKTLARLHEYLDAHLLACQIAAAAPLVLEDTDAVSGGPQYDDVSVTNTVDSDGNTTTYNSTQQHLIDLTNPQVITVPVNKKLSALGLQYPTNGFDVATKVYLQGIAAALNMSYASLTSDSSQESYSTVRHGSIIERDFWKSIQHWYAQRFHRVVFRAWLEESILSGALKLPSPKPEDYYSVDFRPRGYKWQDPVKDMKAYIEGINSGIYTRTQVVAEIGGDWEENIIQLEEELKFAKAHGIPLPEMAEKLNIAQQVADLNNAVNPPVTPPAAPNTPQGV